MDRVPTVPGRLFSGFTRLRLMLAAVKGFELYSEVAVLLKDWTPYRFEALPLRVAAVC